MFGETDLPLLSQLLDVLYVLVKQKFNIYQVQKYFPL